MTFKMTTVEAFGWLMLEILLIFCAGAAFCAVYNWTIPEIFTSLPNLTVAQAIGIRLVAMFGCGNVKVTSMSEDEDHAQHFGRAVGMILIFLLMGFIIKQSI